MIKSGFTFSTSSAMSPNFRDTLGIDLLLITKADRFKRENSFARFAHRVDILFESRRGANHTELAIGITKDRNAPWGVCSTDSADKSVGDIRIIDPDGVALACNTANDVANINVVIAKGQIGTGAITQIRVVATDVEKECYITTGCVTITGVYSKRARPDSGVEGAFGVRRQGAVT